jgi:hypothetical protein
VVPNEDLRRVLICNICTFCITRLKEEVHSPSTRSIMLIPHLIKRENPHAELSSIFRCFPELKCNLVQKALSKHRKVSGALFIT